MDNNNNNDPKRYNKPQMPRSPWFYVMVVLLGVLLISSIVSARSLLGGTVETVEYSAFISMVDEGQVDRVQIGSGIISFTLKTDSTLPRWFYDGTDDYYPEFYIGYYEDHVIRYSENEPPHYEMTDMFLDPDIKYGEGYIDFS